MPDTKAGTPTTGREPALPKGAHRCPECGEPVGGDSGTSPMKHAINCLHINPSELINPRGTWGAAAENGNERAKRVMQLVEWERES